MIKSPYQLPEYLTALERERVQRVIAFLPLLDEINGFEVRPLTLRLYSILRLMNSPFVPPFRTPTTVELAAFLWLLNPEFQPPALAAKRKFLKRCRAFVSPALLKKGPRWLKRRRLFKIQRAILLEAKTVQAARTFMENALADRPESTDVYQPAYYSDECSGVAILASHFPWTEDHILDLPLARFFQYLKWIIEKSYLERQKQPLLSNPSDRIIEKHLGQVNAKN